MLLADCVDKHTNLCWTNAPYVSLFFRLDVPFIKHVDVRNKCVDSCSVKESCNKDTIGCQHLMQSRTQGARKVVQRKVTHDTRKLLHVLKHLLCSLDISEVYCTKDSLLQPSFPLLGDSGLVTCFSFLKGLNINVDTHNQSSMCDQSLNVVYVSPPPDAQFKKAVST